MHQRMTFTLLAALMLVTASNARADSSDDAAKAAQAAEQAAAAAKEAAEAAKIAAQAVEALAKHVAAAEKTGPSAAPLPPWNVQLGVSLLATYGNANAFTGQLTAGVFGHFSEWATEFKLAAAYGETHPRNNQPSEVTAQNAALTARATHNFEPMFGMYFYSGFATDHVASIETQTFGEMGVSVIWLHVETDDYIHSGLKTSLGGRAMYETHHQYYPPAGFGATPLPPKQIYGPVFNVSARYALSKVTMFTEDLDALLDVNQSQDFRLNSVTAMVVQLKEGLSTQLGVTLRYIGAPQPGKLTTDTLISAGLTWAW